MRLPEDLRFEDTDPLITGRVSSLIEGLYRMETDLEEILDGERYYGRTLQRDDIERLLSDLQRLMKTFRDWRF